VNPNWVLRSARLVLTPVVGSDLVDLCAIKADPRVFAVMLGGVLTPEQTAVELAKETLSWGANGFGMWAIRERGSAAFIGMTGLERRPDGRGVALRFALWPEAQGRGLAREAAGAALRSRASRAAAHRRSLARVQLCIAHGVGWHRHDRMQQLPATGLAYADVRERDYPACATCWRIALINASISLLLRLR
jgi:GNAT superfamily N-acetyltransferase